MRKTNYLLWLNGKFVKEFKTLDRALEAFKQRNRKTDCVEIWKDGEILYDSDYNDNL